MAQVELYQEFVVVDNQGARARIGDRTRQIVRPLPIGHLTFLERTIPALLADIILLYAPAVGGAQEAFEWLAIRVDLDGVEIEVTTDRDNTVGTVSSTYTLEKGVWFQIANRVARAGNTGDFNGTPDAIDQIKAQNANSVDANLELVIAV